MENNIFKKRPIPKKEMIESQDEFKKKYKIEDNPLICNFRKEELSGLLEKIKDEYVVFVVGDSLDPEDKKKAIIYLRVAEGDDLNTTYSYYPSNLCPPPRDCDLNNEL